MNIWIVTLFPELFSAFTQCGVIGQAINGKRAHINCAIKFINPRDYAPGNYKSVDDYPFGGSHGMIMRADILKMALIKGILQKTDCNFEENYSSLVREKLRVIYTSPRGVKWNNQIAKMKSIEWFQENPTRDLVFIAGRYEGIDERFIQRYVEEEISLGDFVLSGGEIAIMAFIDSALRFVPGVLGAECGASIESFEENLLEAPQYTKPRVFEDLEVPSIYLSGHHANMQAFVSEERKRQTQRHRPDLL